MCVNALRVDKVITVNIEYALTCVVEMGNVRMQHVNAWRIGQDLTAGQDNVSRTVMGMVIVTLIMNVNVMKVSKVNIVMRWNVNVIMEYVNKIQ